MGDCGLILSHTDRLPFGRHRVIGALNADGTNRHVSRHLFTHSQNFNAPAHVMWIAVSRQKPLAYFALQANHQ